MRALLVAFSVIVAGCIGDRGMPVLSRTPIPETHFTVILCGPDSEGYFHYYVKSPEGYHAIRSVGQLESAQIEPVIFEDLGEKVYRIRWGANGAAAFAVLDFARLLVVEDSYGESTNIPFADPVGSKN